MLLCAQADAGDEVNQLAQVVFVEVGQRIDLGLRSLENRVVCSMASIASSTSLPMVGCVALPRRCSQRDSCGTQKTFSAVYSSQRSDIGADERT